MERLSKGYQRIVIKIGASLLASEGVLEGIIPQIADLIKQKRQVVLVSSGAIACGMRLLGLEVRPTQLSQLQATASLGQNELMQLYRKMFSSFKIKCAQVLLTWEDFNDRRRYLNAKNTLEVLLKWETLPIINENDTVSTEEIKFGDNDRLSALVSNLINADILLILSDVEGLLKHVGGEVIRIVEQITPAIERLGSSSDKAFCVGGMRTKIAAAKIAMESGITCVIVNGKKTSILNLALSDPFNAGTLFLPRQGSLSARKKWLVFCARPKGRIFVDEGAKKALLANKSLLSVGVVGQEGKFGAGDIVEIADVNGLAFARGKVNFSCQELDKIKGKHKMKEIVHRDNLVIWS